MRSARSDSGFSLIEALVALSVLAVSAAGLLATVEEHSRTIAALTDRATARWVAQNRLAEVRLGLSALPDVVRAAGQEWAVRENWSETSDPDLSRVDITVARARDRGTVLARLTGFLDTARRLP